GTARRRFRSIPRSGRPRVSRLTRTMGSIGPTRPSAPRSRSSWSDSATSFSRRSAGPAWSGGGRGRHDPPRTKESSMNAEIAHRHRRPLLAMALLGAAAISLAGGVAPVNAGVGSVYFDGDENVAAGQEFFLSQSFAGAYDVGLGRSVMPNMTTGQDNVGLGF